MKKHLLFFVILAVACLPIQACAVTHKNHGSQTMTWKRAAFGCYITLGGQTLLGADNSSYAQYYSLTGNGVHVRISPITPNNGSWKVTKVSWSNGKNGKDMWVKNVNYKKFTNSTTLMAVTITWENQGLSTTADGKFQKTILDSYTGTFYFNVQHCAKTVSRRR
ncbi:MAG: hypothetical protein WCT27_02830 [Patescibacteria group bacterium]|jgi:hypothetical protein